MYSVLDHKEPCSYGHCRDENAAPEMADYNNKRFTVLFALINLQNFVIK